MAIRFNIAQRRQRWEIDLSSIPVTAVRTNGKIAGVFMLLFALVWGGFGTFGFVAMLRADPFEPAMLMVGLFPIFGIGILLYAVHQLVWRKVVTLDRQTVGVSERGLRGSRQWREPLANYTGVLRRTRRVRTKNSSYTLYLVDLYHAEESKRINLYTDTREGEIRSKWENYARALDQPALEEGAAGVVARDAADLDKSVGELIQEGKIDVDYDALSQPASGVAVNFEGDTVVITRTGARYPWWSALVGVTFPLIFVWVGLYAPDMPWVIGILFAGIGTLFEIIFVVGVIQDRFSRWRLRVGPDGVRVNRVRGRGETAGKSMPAGDIEGVKIAGEGGRWSTSIVMEGDREKLHFGRGLEPVTLEFVMNTVLGKLVEAERRGRN